LTVEALMQTLNIMAVSMATVFGVMAILYGVIRLLVRPGEDSTPE